MSRLATRASVARYVPAVPDSGASEEPREGASAGTPRPVAPTRLLGTPGLFGVRHKAKWKPPPGVSRVALAAAYLQDRVACAVLEELSRIDRPMGDAASVGADPVYLERKLHGHVRADLEDLLGWALELGAGMLPELDDDNDLLPPT
jgi:hypothetical protein